jgi:sigma-54 dependent transcriptional regulator, acetoin dehydrogenase operon transcriptional activator AcoR
MIPNKVAPHMAGSTSRLEGIAQARQAMLMERNGNAPAWLAPWVERSWQRCMGYGLQPQQTATFQVLSPQEMRRTEEANAHLVRTAKPLLENLGRAIVNTRYFAILTNMRGVVVDVSGAIDRSDPRADLITRVGTDLSERSMGTTAISTALAELQPVWLHRGEHFFSNTTHYSCAGAPVIGPDGACAGMLDLTGIEATERPELKHLVTQAASKIENALVLAQPHRLTLRLNWPGNSLGSDADGLVCLDGDGWITGANPIARQMVPHLAAGSAQTVHTLHVSEVFGVAFEQLFDAARLGHQVLEVPLWTGLRLQVMAIERDKEDAMSSLHLGSSRPESGPLKDIETALIRRAVDEARGNVAQAAQALGISRATVYRKLGKK